MHARLAPLWSLVLLAGTGCSTLVQATAPIDLSAPWQGYTQVEVQTRNGSVEISPGTGDTVRIAGRKQVSGATLDEAQKDLERVEVLAEAHPESSQTLLIHLRYPAELKNRNLGAKFVIELPAAVPAKINTSNGHIHVTHLVGPVVLETSNGSVEAHEIDGDLHVDTSNGNVRLEQVRGGITAKTSNGGIAARHVSGASVLSTSNGNVVFVADAANPGPIELRTSNGNIDATIPGGLPADVVCDTSNGRVRFDIPAAMLQQVDAGKSHFRARMNGGGGKFVADTSNGNVTVHGV